MASMTGHGTHRLEATRAHEETWRLALGGR